ncbi:hypothetical protein WAI453_009632 [Rhynchosporium graminicola]
MRPERQGIPHIDQFLLFIDARTTSKSPRPPSSSASVLDLESWNSARAYKRDDRIILQELEYDVFFRHLKRVFLIIEIHAMHNTTNRQQSGQQYVQSPDQGLRWKRDSASTPRPHLLNIGKLSPNLPVHFLSTPVI